MTHQISLVAHLLFRFMSGDFIARSSYLVRSFSSTLSINASAESGYRLVLRASPYSTMQTRLHSWQPMSTNVSIAGFDMIAALSPLVGSFEGPQQLPVTISRELDILGDTEANHTRLLSEWPWMFSCESFVTMYTESAWFSFLRDIVILSGSFRRRCCGSS